MRNLIFLSLFLLCNFSFALTITEIMYNPEGNDSGKEWIEVINNSSETVNILSGKNGWRINDGKNHIFNENLVIYPQEIFVIAQDKNLFSKDYPSFQGKLITANFSLKNESGKIQIFDEQKRLETETNYQSSCGGNGNGYSIFFENGLCYENKIKGGTPGNLLVKDEESTINNQGQEKKNESKLLPATSAITTSTENYSTSVQISVDNQSKPHEISKKIQPTLIISEFFPNPQGNDQGQEFIEIYNYGDEVLDIDGFILESGKNKINLKGKIEPKEYFVLTNKDYNFYLRNNGETLKLYFDNQEIFKISYQGKAPQGKSFSRKKDGSWEFTEPTPGKENIFFAKEIKEGAKEGTKESEQLAQVESLPQQKIVQKTEIFHILGGLIVILCLIFFVWLKL